MNWSSFLEFQVMLKVFFLPQYTSAFVASKVAGVGLTSSCILIPHSGFYCSNAEPCCIRTDDYEKYPGNKRDALP